MSFNPAERQNIVVRVFDKEQYDGEWPPEKLQDAISWLGKKLAEIPEQWRHTATIEIDSSGGYEGAHYAHIGIQYIRPETDREWSDRLERDRAHRAAQEQAERIAYEQLKRKFGGSP